MEATVSIDWTAEVERVWQRLRPRFARAAAMTAVAWRGRPRVRRPSNEQDNPGCSASRGHMRITLSLGTRHWPSSGSRA
jgi:hypothetical protein